MPKFAQRIDIPDVLSLSRTQLTWRNSLSSIMLKVIKGSYKFITYGDRGYSRTKKRLVSEVRKLDIFDEIIAYGPEDFGADFKEKHSRFIEQNPRGGGFWIWKPYFIIEMMEKMATDDILVYADAGCKIYPKHKKRLYEYFEMIRTSKFGLLNFQIRPGDYDDLPPTIDRLWTKADLAQRMGVIENDEIMDSHQILATTLIIRKCELSMKILKEWYSLCTEDYHLLDDTPSIVPNHEQFAGHRHDQSVLSLCLKKYGTLILPDETYDIGDSIIGKNHISDNDMMPKKLFIKIKMVLLPGLIHFLNKEGLNDYWMG